MKKLRRTKEVRAIVPISILSSNGEIKIQTARFTFELPLDVLPETLCMAIGA